jgi:hypothetical protein
MSNEQLMVKEVALRHVRESYRLFEMNQKQLVDYVLKVLDSEDYIFPFKENVMVSSFLLSRIIYTHMLHPIDQGHRHRLAIL